MPDATAPSAECRNGHPWTTGQTFCSECGATPRAQWGPVSAIKPAGFPHSDADWIVCGIGFMLLSLACLGAARHVESEDASTLYEAGFVVFLMIGWFFVTVAAVIKGASIALADRDRRRG